MTIVDCAVYEEGRRRDGHLELEEAYEACSDGDCFVWIGLYEPSPDEFDSVSREFQLHPLAVEDAIKAHQRPKLEIYDDTLFMVLKTASYDEETETVAIGEIDLFVGRGFLVSVRHGTPADLEGLRSHIEGRPEILRHGPAAVLQAIMDRVVDHYEPVLAGVEDDIEEAEEEVFSPSRSNPTERIYKLKREVIELHRATHPLIDPLHRLSSGQVEMIPEDVRHYYRDVYDHVVRADERVEGFQERLGGILQANLTQVGVRQNEDMRKISAWVAIIALPTMIAGIYGMNFEHMPELEWTFGYPLVVAVMLAGCTGLYVYFKRVGWF